MNASTVQLYRKTAIGEALSETLEEMTDKFSITPEIANKISEKFDQIMIKHLENSSSNNKTTIKALSLDTYNNFESVWKFSLSGVTIKTDYEQLTSERLKILACDKAQLEDRRTSKNNAKNKRQGKKKK